MFGYDFAAYIEQQKREYYERKDQERVERASKKQHQLEHVSQEVSDYEERRRRAELQAVVSS